MCFMFNKKLIKMEKNQTRIQEKASQINIESNLEDNLCNSCYTKVIRHDRHTTHKRKLSDEKAYRSNTSVYMEIDESKDVEPSIEELKQQITVLQNESERISRPSAETLVGKKHFNFLETGFGCSGIIV